MNKSSRSIDCNSSIAVENSSIFRVYCQVFGSWGWNEAGMTAWLGRDRHTMRYYLIITKRIWPPHWGGIKKYHEMVIGPKNGTNDETGPRNHDKNMGKWTLKVKQNRACGALEEVSIAPSHCRCDDYPILLFTDCVMVKGGGIGVWIPKQWFGDGEAVANGHFWLAASGTG